MIDIHARLTQLLTERQWSVYRLAKESGLSNSTVANIFSRNALPSLDTLQLICNAFGITLSQFFAAENDGNMVVLTAEQKTFFDRWISLTAQEKQVLYDLMNIFTKTE